MTDDPTLADAAPAAATAVRRAAVLGSPIRHSLSPVLHGAAYEALGLSGWHYDRIECDEAGLPALVDGMGPEWAGLSLTMPLKRVLLTVADEVSPLAAAVGAGNTLVFEERDGRRVRWADNTDVAGLVAALRETGLERVETAVILGAGGTAQAALAALRELGNTTPRVLVRDVRRTGDLVAAAERLGVEPDVSGALLDAPIPEADLVVSTLPGGAADALTGRWTPGTVVLDAVYAGWPTPFARAAQAAGCRVVSGLVYLLHQAVVQVELMTGRRPGPVDAMRAALTAAVAARS